MVLFSINCYFRAELMKVLDKIMDFSDYIKDFVDDSRILSSKPWVAKTSYAVITVLSIWVLSWVPTMIWISGEPESKTNQQLIETYGTTVPVIGSYSVAAAIHTTMALHNKSGGYLSNDILPPFTFVDNIPQFEWGAVQSNRLFAQLIRSKFSKSQSGSPENEHIKKGEPDIQFHHDKWIFPNTEKYHKKYVGHLKDYYNAIHDPADTQSQFYTRADYLAAYLEAVEGRMSSYAKTLGKSQGSVRMNEDLSFNQGAQQSTNTSNVIYEKLGWTEIDDIFYEARGFAWSTLHFMQALEVDYASVLEKKNATDPFRNAILELQDSQDEIWSLFIQNGLGMGRFGFFNDHCNALATSISRANTQIIKLKNLLREG